MVVLLVLFLAVVLRMLPIRLAPHGAGIDQWFWRVYIEKVRSSGEFPPVLPQFRLDEAQWYPPLFPWLMARAPAMLLDRHANLLAVVIDLTRLMLLIAAVYMLSGTLEAMLVAGLVYAATPVLITYNMQLNPRGLGALFLDGALLALAAALWRDGGVMAWGLAMFCGGLVLLTHKMTTQLMIFVVLVATLVLHDARLLLLPVGAVFVAMLLSAGLYARVARAHKDILLFWFHNWRWSGSNPILESPIYGDPGYESPSKFYRAGWRAWVRRLQFVVGFSPWMPSALIIGVFVWLSGRSFSGMESGVFVWLAIIFAFALATTLLPFLRCMGQGYLYGYNGSFPAAMAVGLSSVELGGELWWRILVALTALAVFVALFAFFRALCVSRTLKVDVSLSEAVEHLADLPSGVVMCLPQHWHDVVAYRTGKPVAFGGHGYGFRLLQPVFPRLLVPLSKFIADQDVRYILLWPDYVNERFLDEIPLAEVENFGEYRLYRLKPVISK